MEKYVKNGKGAHFLDRDRKIIPQEGDSIAEGVLVGSRVQLVP